MEHYQTIQMVRHFITADRRNRRFIYTTRVLGFILLFIRPVSVLAVFAGVSSTHSNDLVPFNCVRAYIIRFRWILLNFIFDFFRE